MGLVGRNGNVLPGIAELHAALRDCERRLFIRTTFAPPRPRLPEVFRAVLLRDVVVPRERVLLRLVPRDVLFVLPWLLLVDFALVRERDCVVARCPRRPVLLAAARRPVVRPALRDRLPLVALVELLRVPLARRPVAPRDDVPRDDVPRADLDDVLEPPLRVPAVADRFELVPLARFLPAPALRLELPPPDLDAAPRALPPRKFRREAPRFPFARACAVSRAISLLKLLRSPRAVRS